MKPIINKCEDGSVLIEFIKKDWRFYLAIEKDLKESSWGFCAREGKLKNWSESGDLSESFLKLVTPENLAEIVEKAAIEHMSRKIDSIVTQLELKLKHTYSYRKINVNDPKFDEAQRVHDWRNHVSTDMKDLWDNLSKESRLILAIKAAEDADKEVWE
jgi:hypothetical protein